MTCSNEINEYARISLMSLNPEGLFNSNKDFNSFAKYIQN